jgi:hypothetical protein
MIGVDRVLMGFTLLIAAYGVAGIMTGWVLPWNRSKVRRPRLSGIGSLVTAAGTAVWGVLGPMTRSPHGSSAYVAWTGWILFTTGLLIHFLAQRHGRAPGDATKTSS